MKNYSEIKVSDFDTTEEGEKATFVQKRSSVSKGELTCVVMVANEIDAHGDMFTIECVKKAYEDYVNTYNESSKAHGTQHAGNIVDAQLLSHWFTESGGVFDDVEAPANSFIAKFKINEESVKKQYESGSLTGVSIEAKATAIPFSYLEEKGYTVNDCMQLTKSKVKNSKFDVPKRIILKTKINKIDFVDMGANLRVGIYKSSNEELPVQNNEVLIEKEHNEVNDILDDGLFINLTYEIETKEQVENLLKSWQYAKPEQNIQKRLTKILLDNDYDISYDYIKTSLTNDFDQNLLKQIEDKYNKEIKESKMEVTKELLDVVRKVVEEITTEKAASQAEKEKQEKIIKEQEEKVALEKAEKESLQQQITELKTQIEQLSKKEIITEVQVEKNEVKTIEVKEEDIEVKVEKAVNAKLETLISRLASGSNSEVKKSDKKSGSALDNFFE
jgi:hypothetical protein